MKLEGDIIKIEQIHKDKPMEDSQDFIIELKVEMPTHLNELDILRKFHLGKAIIEQEED